MGWKHDFPLTFPLRPTCRLDLIRHTNEKRKRKTATKRDNSSILPSVSHTKKTAAHLLLLGGGGAENSKDHQQPFALFRRGTSVGPAGFLLPGFFLPTARPQPRSFVRLFAALWSPSPPPPCGQFGNPVRHLLHFSIAAEGQGLSSVAPDAAHPLAVGLRLSSLSSLISRTLWHTPSPAWAKQRPPRPRAQRSSSTVPAHKHVL